MDDPKEPYFITYLLTEESIKGFEDRIQEAITVCKEKEVAGTDQGEKTEEEKTTTTTTTRERYCVIGLHTCGDLATRVIDLFCKSPSAVAVVGIGCCYYNIMPPHGTLALHLSPLTQIRIVSLSLISL